MSNLWLISDTHFGHDAVYSKFKRADGSPLRPWAETAEQGDAIIRETWNARVQPRDKVIHLGDVSIPRKGLKMLEGLNGRKVLIRGNHDIFKLKDYSNYFEDILGTCKTADFILTHYPIHAESIPAWCKGIIHGHTHSNIVTLDNGEPDPRYQNVCIEHTDHGPISFDEVKENFK